MFAFASSFEKWKTNLCKCCDCHEKANITSREKKFEIFKARTYHTLAADTRKEIQGKSS